MQEKENIGNQRHFPFCSNEISLHCGNWKVGARLERKGYGDYRNPREM